jgi:hypothetical protein
MTSLQLGHQQEIPSISETKRYLSIATYMLILGQMWLNNWQVIGMRLSSSFSYLPNCTIIST